MIRFRCPRCNKQLKSPFGTERKRCRCMKCGKRQRVPGIRVPAPDSSLIRTCDETISKMLEPPKVKLIPKEEQKRVLELGEAVLVIVVLMAMILPGIAWFTFQTDNAPKATKVNKP